ncbi:hypothetical protein H9Q70_000073 [Fusarium xylarioides]|nr:hypothetical protein H9Q70_000073 [Fusarium xylarioides]
MLSENCRKAAAIDKTSETRMAASLVPSLVKKVATAHPLVRLNEKLCSINPELIMAIHKALRTDADNAGEYNEHDDEHLGDMLPHNALPFLLESCHNMIPMADAHEDVVLREVKAILPYCQ